MANYTVKKLSEMEAMQIPADPRNQFRRVGAELGVSSMGCSVQDYPPHFEHYPGHLEPEQEEVYVALGGSGEWDVGGERVNFDPSMMLRVGPTTPHKLYPGADGARLLAIGGIPGKDYSYVMPEMLDPADQGWKRESPDFTAKRIEDMEAIFGGAFRRARAELGVSSFGLSLSDFPPNADQYPEHADDEQEEVYLFAGGSGEIDIEGERFPLDPETVVRVGPGTKKKIFAGGDGLRMIAIGAIPGKPFKVAGWTELGEPDPLDQ
jgi:mannose-6-phosphate isomerase-like protein (cupin superfamily)